MKDDKGSMYSCGENSQGNLGFGDNKNRRAPIQIPFFENKRVIDFTCGDGFTVVIAETYNMTRDIERLYFNLEKKSLADIGKNSRTEKPLFSKKMHVQCPEENICQSSKKSSQLLPQS